MNINSILNHKPDLDTAPKTNDKGKDKEERSTVDLRYTTKPINGHIWRVIYDHNQTSGARLGVLYFTPRYRATHEIVNINGQIYTGIKFPSSDLNLLRGYSPNITSFHYTQHNMLHGI